MSKVDLDIEQQLYVITNDEGISCLGFDTARQHAEQIARRLGCTDLAFAEGEYGSLPGYEKYLDALQAWGKSPLSHTTYFDPGTDPKAAGVLEDCRKDRRKVRLIFGNTDTGDSWLDEHDVVGRIGRSTGTLKVPLLVATDKDGGSAIQCAWILAIIDWEFGEVLYRHAAYREADLRIRSSDDGRSPWQVVRQEEVVAGFDDIGKAGAYLAFMRGASVEPRVFR